MACKPKVRARLIPASSPPKARGKGWFRHVSEQFELEKHHVRLLTLAAEAWDRGEQARAALDVSGLTYDDRFGSPHARPEVAIERDSRMAFARLVRELNLDVEPPGAGRASGT